MRCRALTPFVCLLLVLPTFGLSGCSSVAKILDFNMTQTIPSQTVPGSPLGSLLPAGILSFPFTVNLASQEQANGTGPASSVTLTSLTLTITAPTGQTWDFLSSITVSVSSSQSGSSLPTIEIAKLSSVPQGQTTISIPPDPGVNLIAYINEGAQVTSSASGQEPQQNATFDGQAILLVGF
jgi:hypothetical protein